MVSWISQTALDRHIDALVKRSRDAHQKAVMNIDKNVVDPFSSLISAHARDIEERFRLIEIQSVASSATGISSAMGEFHQTVLGSVEGWQNHDSGYDLESPTQQMLAEVKNKHNTMNSTNFEKVVDNLKTALRQKRGSWTGYLVQIIPKKPDRFKRDLGAGLYEIDGASFYHLVTGSLNGIHELFDYMLKRISPSPEVAEYCQSVLARSLPARLSEDAEGR